MLTHRTSCNRQAAVGVVILVSVVFCRPKSSWSTHQRDCSGEHHAYATSTLLEGDTLTMA